MIDLPVDEVTVSVDEGTGKSVFVDERNRHARIVFLGSGNKDRWLPTSLTV